MLKKRLDKPNPIRAGGIWDVSRSKRQMETLTRPRFSGPPVGGRSSPEVELIQALVLFLLVLDVVPDDRLVPPDRRNEISSAQKCCPMNPRWRSP
jgi:hypothetical protein